MRDILIALLLTLCLPAGAQQMIRGRVVDEATGQHIGYASVKYKDRQLATITDTQGRFTIRRVKGARLVVSVLGYKSKTIDVSDDTDRLFISLRQDAKALDEVTVRAKRSRYSRKNNPAVELMRKVIARKRQTKLTNRDFYQYQKYQKLTLALNDMSLEALESPRLRKLPWLLNQTEVCEQTGKLILPVSVEETVSQYIYRRKPHSEKTIIKGQKSAGVNDFFQTGDIINTISKDIFTDINIYDDQVRILQHPFTSPIGAGAIAFYRFYIEDTLQVAGDSCIHLHFLPNNQQDFGFRGDLYILNDSSYQVKRCDLQLPRQTDVNFVENLRMTQEFTRLPTGEWVLSTDDMIVEMVIYDFLQRGVAIKTTRLSDYSFDDIPRHLFRGKAKTVIAPNARMEDDDFWLRNRKVRLTRSERSMDTFLDNIRKTGGFALVMTALKILMENYIETAPRSKIDIGPVSSLVSHNFIDGLRTRLGAQTTAYLSPHLFVSGYAARGWKSRKTYYGGELTWALNKKKYLPDEFPKRNITLQSTYDVMSPCDKFLTTDKDNVFTSFKWAKVDKMMFYNRQQLTLEREEDWGLRSLLSIKAEENRATGNLTFTPVACGPPGGDGATPPHSIALRTTELRAELEYSPGALYINSKMRRTKVNRDAPVYRLSHTIGIKGLLGGDYSYHYTEASVQKRFWLSSWGRIDLFARGGVQWSQVPFPMLCMPATNLSYISHKHTFQLISNMEFLTDRFVSLDFNWDMQGKLLNRVPLVKRLKWREYIGAKVFWGALSDKNNPTLARNADSNVLMWFPDESGTLNPKVPYWEISLGIRSIFRFFQVEYVRRMNYNDHRHGPKNSVRFGFTMMF